MFRDADKEVVSKADEIACTYHYIKGTGGIEDEVLRIYVADGCIQMAEWYKPLVNLVKDYLGEDCEAISLDIQKDDEDWCEKNCKEFNEACIYKWLETQAKKGERHD